MLWLLTILATLSLLIWLVLVLAPDQAYRYREILHHNPEMPPATTPYPEVSVIIPARNEEKMLARTLPSIVGQTYPNFEVVLVDDQSSDHTREVAQKIQAQLAPNGIVLRIVTGEPLPQGWAGKVWAMAQGVKKAHGEWVLFTDADIEYPPQLLRSLVDYARSERKTMVSLMARLSTRFFWEKLLISAFLYFFKLLYPFRTVANPQRKMAAAAGGCILLKQKALEAAGGITKIAGAIIDDIALARVIKAKKFDIALLVSPDLLSLREYQTLGEIWHMVTRSAFTELKYSYLRLLFCIVAMTVTYFVPIVALVYALGLLACYVQSVPTNAAVLISTLTLAGIACATLFLTWYSYRPTIAYLKVSKWFAFSLPVAALLYLLMTLHSAWRYLFGVKSAWKGRQYQKEPRT